MTPQEIAQKLRHDLKYAGFTIQNIDLTKPLEGWAAKAIWKDLFATRKGLSCLQLAVEAQAQLTGTSLEAGILLVVEAAKALEPYRDKVQAGAEVGELQNAVRVLLQAAEKLAKNAV